MSYNMNEFDKCMKEKHVCGVSTDKNDCCKYLPPGSNCLAESDKYCRGDEVIEKFEISGVWIKWIIGIIIVVALFWFILGLNSDKNSNYRWSDIINH